MNLAAHNGEPVSDLVAPCKLRSIEDAEHSNYTSTPGAREALEKAKAALDRIIRWHGEFPPTGRTWDDGSPMSYSAAFGSNGERDYMREHAAKAAEDVEAALAALPSPPPAGGIPEGWRLVPVEPTHAMVEAARNAHLAPGKVDGYPIWDNMSTPRTADKEDWEDVLPGITKGAGFHASYEWPRWQEHLLRVAYRAMISAAPPCEGNPIR